MMGSMVTIGALGRQFGLCRMDKHNSFGRQMGTLQVEHITLANVLHLSRLALRIFQHTLYQLIVGQRGPLVRVVIET